MPGTVLIEADLSTLRARAAASAGVITAVLASAMTFAVGPAVHLQRVMPAPLRRLTSVIRRVTQDRTHNASVEGEERGKFAELIAGYNDRLAGLERMVEQRTAELRTANADLARARDQAVEASRAKSEFVARMSLEIRTPIHGILGVTDAALRTSPSLEHRTCLETVRTSANSLLKILDVVLDVSKIESGALRLEAVPLSVADVLAELMKPLSLRASEKGLRVACQVAPSVPAAVLGDPLRLRQVLVNLIGNAIKFTHRGTVAVFVEREPIPHDGVCLHFIVEDTGIGISWEHRAGIFEAFNQTDRSGNGGTGLNLAVTRTLVRMMRGRIWVESTPGQGSRFHVLAHFGAATEAARPIIDAATEPPVVARACPGRRAHNVAA